MSIRRAVRLAVAYVAAMRKTLAFLIAVGATVLAAALLFHVSPSDVVAIARDIEPPSGVGEWIVWVAASSLKVAPVLGLVEFAVLRPEQRVAIEASVFEDHFVVVGLGHLGLRVARDLLRSGESVIAVVLPRDVDGEAADEIRDMGGLVLAGDAASRKTLEAAGVTRARALILTVDDDTLNSVVAERARELSPDLRIVARMFREEIAKLLVGSGAASAALSASEISSDFFFAAAMGFSVVGDAPIPVPVRLDRTVVVGEGPLGRAVLAALSGDGSWRRVGDGERVEAGGVVLLDVRAAAGLGMRS